MVDNQSGFPHLLFEKRGYRGKPFDVLVVRGTFDFSSNGNPMPRAARQEPIQYGDSLIGPAAHDPSGPCSRPTATCCWASRQPTST